MKSQTLSSQWAGPPKILLAVCRLSGVQLEISVSAQCPSGDWVCVCVCEREVKTNQFLWAPKIVCVPAAILWPADIQLLHIDVQDLLWWWSSLCFNTPDGNCGFTTPWDHSETNTLQLLSVVRTTSQWVFTYTTKCWWLSKICLL